MASLPVTDGMQELYGFELDPEVHDWLDGLSDIDCKHAYKATETYKRQVWAPRLRPRGPAPGTHGLAARETRPGTTILRRH